MTDDNNKWAVLMVISLAYFVAPMIGMSINVALPTIGRDLMIDAVLLAWIPTSFIMSSAMFVVPAGRIADIYGRKRIFLWGTVISAITSLFLGFSNSAASLIAFRAIQGLGAAMIISTGLAIVSSAFPDNERGKAIGLCAAAVYSGQSFAPFLGGLLTQHLGWRSIFLINVPLCLIIIIFVLWKMKQEWAEAKGDEFDISGSVIYALTIFSVVYGFSSLPGTKAVGFILAGFLGGVLFILWEKKVRSPILDVTLFMRNRTFAFSNISNFIHYSAVYAIAFLMSLYLQYIKGLSPQNAGFILVSQPVIQALFSPLAGRLADRTQPRIISSIGMALTALGILSLATLTEETSISWILFSLMLIGFGVAFF
ncbi:MAG: MFS transporter, partial [Pseudomonadota bacterium]